MSAGQPNRLPRGGRIARDRPVAFRFNGRDCEGYAGDTLASALLANGVSVVGRSFKYHRPRGIVGSGAEEPNAIVQLDAGAQAVPAARATLVRLRDGLAARSIRGWPCLRFDLLAFSDVVGPLLAAGFYYKTFMGPAGLWEQYEKILRRASGMGVCPDAPDPDCYDRVNAHCDVLVAGGGPAGLTAALAAGRSGARVILADDQSEAGGSLLFCTQTLDGEPARQWLDKTLAELAQLPNVTVLPNSTVAGYYDHNFLTILEQCGDRPGQTGGRRIRQRLWRVRARQVVLAQGAFERPLVFCNNDRPGIMQASAVSEYVNRYAVRPGRRGLIFTNNDSAYRTALDLNAAGVEVAAVIDSRADGAGGIGDAVRGAGIEVLHGHAVTDVAGRRRVRAARVAALARDAREPRGRGRRIACDFIAVSGGWSPAVHLHTQGGGRCEWRDDGACFVPRQGAPDNLSAGACNGRFGLDECLREGLHAGAEAARRCGFEIAASDPPATETVAENPLQPLWRVPASRNADRCPKQFLDFQNDTTVADVRLAVREGYESIEHVKRYTALGFGTDQGKLGNINGAAVLAETLGKTIAETGTTTFRQPYTPVAFGACAGRGPGSELYDPVRRTMLHPWHEEAGAVFETVGQWLRPRHYPRGAEDMDAAVRRECLAVRNGVGIMDASTLGKIELQGPQATEFLNRIYPNDCTRIPVGRCRYGLVLGEDGMVMDDGVLVRLGEEHYYATTTTGGAAAVLDWMERWLQTEWPELKVYMTSVTEHWATVTVAGPDSRKLLRKLCPGVETGAEEFRFMSCREGVVAGIPARIFRISFSGELAFEISVDNRCARGLWDALLEAGAEFGVTPYGTETMHVLRAEKGYPIIGQDTDGTVTPHDLGLSRMVAADKDFLGKRSFSRPDSVREDRKQFVGLVSEDGETVLPEGAQLITAPQTRRPTPMEGHVTSSYWSPALKHPIALALIRAGSSRIGQTLYASLRDGRDVAVRITNPVFYDPDGDRQKI